MKKVMIMFAMVFLMVGVVSADRSLVNVVNFSMPGNVVAGSSFDASFSFDYKFGGDNVDGSPLIINLSIVSDDEINYPVMKRDFEISGRVEKSWFFNMLTKSVEFNCSEEYEQTIEHPLDAQNVTADDGVFYCYNEEGDLELEESDKVTLNIVSHHALYPGEYTFSASMFYLTDERAPFVNITNKGLFEDNYFNVGNSITINAMISDYGGLKENGYGAIVLNGTTELFRFGGQTQDGVYYFPWNIPSNMVEWDYTLMIFGEDVSNNSGNDSVTLKIDRSAPNITLVQPSSNSTYGENDSLVIEVGAVDAKAGLDNSSVMYRISEIVNGSFCPDSGIIFGDYSCYNSGWVEDWDSNFVVEINISGSDFVSGSYWLEAGACDVLGNCGVL